MAEHAEPNPLSAGTAPPPLPAKRSGTLAFILSLGLALFLIDAVVSVLDDALILCLGTHVLSPLRGLVFLGAAVVLLVVYVLMAITPKVPKRLFLPLTLFAPVTGLLFLTYLIYAYRYMQAGALALSLVELAVALLLIRVARGEWSMAWPLIDERRLAGKLFTWANLMAFLALNLFVLLPAFALYLFFCASTAVDRFSEGFLALRSSGFIVEARKYVRADGKAIHLIPMAHVGDAAFYRELSRSFPSNALVLAEGVSDDHNLLTNRISYRRMAKSLGLAEQQQEFKPTRRNIVHADIDVSEFSTNTLNFINLVMLFHARGLDADTLLKISQYAPAPGFEAQLFEDLLGKRNQRVLREARAQLADHDEVIVPWGAAHMPGIARELVRDGFHVAERRRITAIAFRSRPSHATIGTRHDRE